MATNPKGQTSAVASPDPLTDLIPGWEMTLLAATYPKREVRGKVRANKQLARLQREGFPIRIKFRNIAMGPASIDVESRAQKAEGSGLLAIRKVQATQEDFDSRTDFVLTDAGYTYVDATVIPAVSKHPKGRLYKRAFARGMVGKFQPTKALISEAHETLLLDDGKARRRLCQQLQEDLKSLLDTIGNPRGIRDSMTLLVGATFELALTALDHVEPSLADEDDGWTGKNHILAKSQELTELGEEWKRLRDLPKMAKSLQEDFELILNALELNCEVYDIIEMPDEREIDELLGGVEPYDLEKGHE
jgi:hypothetical protein